MRMRARVIGTVTLLVGICLLAVAGSGSAAVDKKKIAAELDKIADLLEKGKQEEAKKAAVAFAKDKDFDLAEVMAIFKLRTKGGVGVGAKTGEIKPDGVEAMFISLEKAQKKTVETYTNELGHAAYLSAAVALVIADKCPVQKKMKDKDPKEWKQWSEDMSKASLDLAAAAKDKNLAKVKDAAKKVNNSCVSCHGPFRQD